MTAFGLTAKQQRLLSFVTAELEAGRPAPSYTEMVAFMGAASRSNIHRLVGCLLDRGHLVYLPGRARSLALPPPLSPAPPPSPFGISKDVAERFAAYCDHRGVPPRAAAVAALTDYMRRNP